jgi:hypothetical protein
VPGRAESLAAAPDYLAFSRVAECTQLAAGNFLTEVPDGDLHVLSQVLHNWDDENVRRIAGNCARARARAIRWWSSNTRFRRRRGLLRRKRVGRT